MWRRKCGAKSAGVEVPKTENWRIYIHISAFQSAEAEVRGRKVSKEELENRSSYFRSPKCQGGSAGEKV